MIATLIFANPWPWWLVVPLLAGIGVLLAWLYRRERKQVSPRVGVLLTALRIALVVMLFFTLLAPVISTQITRTTKDTLLLLVDQSRSMAIRDDPRGPTRAEQVRKVFDAVLLNKLQNTSQLHAYRFAASGAAFDPREPWAGPDGDTTDLGRPAAAALTDLGTERVGAAVLVSDGVHNRGPNPLEAAAKFAERQVKLFTVGIGPSTPPKDIAVAEVASSGLVFSGDEASATVAITSSGYRGQRAPVRVLQNGKVIGESYVTPGGDPSRDTAIISFRPQGDGSQLLSVEVPPQPGEANAENNVRLFRVQVLKDKLKILLIESHPRWEFRYLKNDLLRDKPVELTTILLAEPNHPPLPSSRQEWFKYSVIILGDLTPNQLTPAAEQQLESFVADNGGTLIAIAGRRGMPAAWRNQRLADLLPIVPAAEAVEGKELQLQLSPAGREHPITHLVPDPAANEKLWTELSPFYWQWPAASTKPAATALITTAVSPLLVTQYYGIGKVLFLGSDNTWRWRFKVADENFHRFWGQIIRWAARSPFSARDQHVMIGTSRDEFGEGDPVKVEARVLGADFSPLNDSEVTAVVFKDNQPLRRVRMEHVAGSGGLYRCAINDLPRAEYALRLEVPALPQKLSQAAALFGVRDLPSQETQAVAMNEPLLKEMAALTGGKFLRLNEASRLPDELKFLERREKVSLELELWDTPWWFAVFCLLIITEWSVRKWNGLA
ncbi:MAG: hypothetical protein HZC54_11940 [Verrucomicrobia bacterium]|nr:hypothetical protein [Verrucomicrobiota bacterium]